MAKPRKVLKWIGIVIGSFVALIVAVVAYFAATFPPTFEVAPVELAASDDPAVIAEGAYLFHAVSHCGACHVPRETYATVERGDYANVLPIGGVEISFGPLATLRGSNLTSDRATGIGAMGDAELAQITRHAIRADGTPAYFMVTVARMTDRDLVAIMSYLRSLPPVVNEIAPSEVSVLGKVLFSTVLSFFIEPSRHGWESPPYVAPGDAPSVERGHYLAVGPAGCIACHSVASADDPWQLDRPFAGANAPIPDETDPSFMFYAPNLTPHPERGWMASWSEDAFVERMTEGRHYAGSPMPWENILHITDNDLRSIYQYLHTLEPNDFDTGPIHRPKSWRPGDPDPS